METLFQEHLQQLLSLLHIYLIIYVILYLFSILLNVSQVFLAKQSQWYEPKSYKDTAPHHVWQLAMEQDLKALDANNTREIVALGPQSETPF